MGIDRRAAAAAAVAVMLPLGMLTACGNGSKVSSSGGTAPVASAPIAPSSSALPSAGGTTGTGTDPGSGPSGGQQAGGGSGTALKGKVVVVDPGHNGGNAAHPEVINKLVDIGNGRKACDTTGTETNAGYSEHAYTWDVSNRLAKLLRARGAEVVLTRSSDTGVGPCINKRAGIGNKADADAAVSIHADGAPKSGRGFHIIEPVALSGLNAGMVAGSKKLALALRKAYKDGTGMPYSNYRGTEALDPRDDLGGLNLSKVPKVFIETGNMRNPGDAAKLSDAAFRQRIAEALDVGLVDYLTGN